MGPPVGFQRPGAANTAVTLLKREDLARPHVLEYVGDRRGTSEHGEWVLHVFRDGTGQEVGIWGSAMLTGRLANVTPGRVVWLVYCGLQRSEKSGHKLHAWDVAVGPPELTARTATLTEVRVEADDAGGEEVPF